MQYFRGLDEAKKGTIAELELAKEAMLERLEMKDTHYTSPLVEGEEVLKGSPVSCWMSVGPKGNKSLLSVTGCVIAPSKRVGGEKVAQYYEVLLNCGTNPDSTIDYTYYRIHDIDGVFRGGDSTFDVDFVGILDNGAEIPVTTTLKTEGDEVIRMAKDGKVSQSAISRISTEDATRLAGIMSSIERYALQNKNKAVIGARAAKEKVQAQGMAR